MYVNNGGKAPTKQKKKKKAWDRVETTEEDGTNTNSFFLRAGFAAVKDT